MREGWLSRKFSDPERVRDPADGNNSPVYVEERTGTYVRRDLAILSVRQEVICLIIARRDESYCVDGELEPFFVRILHTLRVK